MLSFNSVDFSYQPENKGFDLPTYIDDDPFSEFFDQYISRDPTDLSDNTNDSNGLGVFFDEDTTSSGSNVAGTTFSDVSYKEIEQSQVSPLDRASLPTGYQKYPRHERPKPVISGLQLLNLEGKLPLPEPPQSAPASIPAFPLRRKPRFSATPAATVRDRNQRISKSPCNPVGESQKMMRPPYYHRHEMPSFHEWTQRFEKMSVQSAVGSLDPSPTAPHYICEQEKPRGPQDLTDKSFFGNQVTQGETYNGISSPLQGFPESQPTSYAALAPPTISSTSAEGTIQLPKQSSTPSTKAMMRREKAKSSSTLPQVHQSSTWTQPPALPEDFDFAVSPTQIQSPWLDDLLPPSEPYYDNFLASQSAPTLAHPVPQYNTQSPQTQFDHYRQQFITEDPSEDYFITPSDPFAAPPPQATTTTTLPDLYTPLFPPPTTHHPTHPYPRTPSSPSSSRSPSPTTTTPHRRSKSRAPTTRRKPSAHTLKSRKSAPSGLGFVNFTPKDKGKILGGVAPSGSSKTKARREEEAKEKKRRLSQALVRRLRKPGGVEGFLEGAGVDGCGGGFGEGGGEEFRELLEWS